MARRRGYPPVGELGQLTAVLPSLEEVKSLLFVGGSGTAAMIGSRLLFSKITFLSGLHWGIRAAIKVLLGAALGKMASKLSPFAGVGVGGGFIINAVGDDILPNLMPSLGPVSGFSGGAPSDFDLFGDVSVQEHALPDDWAYGGFEVDEQPEYVPA